MKCPILSMGRRYQEGGIYPEKGDCLEKECALWDHQHHVCGEKVIKKALDSIAHSLADIAAKMPHEGQFTK